jgi:hypothetical protein
MGLPPLQVVDDDVEAGALGRGPEVVERVLEDPVVTVVDGDCGLGA